jgi:2-(1,2-epoxy-1,2-dihydrophenyl)acetyl-CoA isomerase
VRLGSPAARFKSVFIERSLSPDSGLSYFLPRIVGYSAAADLIFSSRVVEAQEAQAMGLLNRIVPAESLLDEAVAYAEQTAQWPPLALRMSKRVLQHSIDAGLQEALRYESVALGLARKAPNDVKESRLAFIEKRKGVYTGS